jgi:hypothetical protein
MTSLDRDPEERQRQRAAGAAGAAARHAAINLARDAGAQIISRPIFPGAHSSTSDVEPLAGLRAIRDIELGARYSARNYIRDARETGHSWHEIGTALGLIVGADFSPDGQNIAEAAYTYAAGNPDTDAARRYGRSFGWTCQSCESVISDRGLCNGPAEDEAGHAPGCMRLAATEATWDAEWEAGQ